ncbi:MAG: hypothetical protein ACFFCQ_12930, partial [Promethearchaeota archaeon]
MQKSVKILLFVGFPLIIIVSMIFIGLSAFNVVEKEQEGKPFSLEDAPSHIIEIKADLKSKFENETFTWNDMPRFVTFCQYLADNAPDIL